MESFLPKDFDYSAPCVLLAGRGDYPRLLWSALKGLCPRAVVFGFEAEAVPWMQAIPDNQRFTFEVGQVGHWLQALKKVGACYVLLAGQIQPKKLFHGLKPDLKAIWLLSKLKEKNATTIFGTLIDEMEALGITVLDARCFMETQLTSKGLLTRKAYTEIDDATLQHGIRVCRGIAELDIGQSVVVHKGTTVLVEGFDGTDALIERAGAICNHDMGLVKLAKPTQDFRYDVPIFGLHTLQTMQTAGIQWAALEAERTLILDKPAVLEAADRHRITLIGF